MSLFGKPTVALTSATSSTLLNQVHVYVYNPYTPFLKLNTTKQWLLRYFMNMKFLRSFATKSSSYVVHKDESDSDLECSESDKWVSLTVWRKSLVFSCYGFTVIDSSGDLVYRVDNYMGAKPEEILLMDGYGFPILTLVQNKKMKVFQSWLVYRGESSSEQLIKEPMYTVKKQVSIMGSSSSSSSSTKVLAKVYLGASNHKQHASYTILGSYSQRSCKILKGSKRSTQVVAEIKRKEMTMKSGEGVSFGTEVFVLSVQPDFDRGVAMGLVLLLDQMFS